MESFFDMMYGRYFAPLPDVDAYLARIGMKREDITLDRSGLDALQRAQLYSVPFENIDLYDYGQPVDFGIEALFDKVVTRRRGGYCFELNAIFMSLLEAVGFEVHACGARLLFIGGAEPWARVPALTHRISLVTIGGKRYMSDVGVGNTSAPLVSICIDDYDEQDIAGDTYTVEDRPHNNKLIIRHTDEGPTEFMLFVPTPTPLADFYHINYSMSREGVFHMKRMANLRNEHGAMSIDGGIFRVFHDGVVTETPLTDGQEARRILLEKYGMLLDDRPLKDKAEIEMMF